MEDGRKSTLVMVKERRQPITTTHKDLAVTLEWIVPNFHVLGGRWPPMQTYFGFQHTFLPSPRLSRRPKMTPEEAKPRGSLATIRLQQKCATSSQLPFRHIQPRSEFRVLDTPAFLPLLQLLGV